VDIGTMLDDGNEVAHILRNAGWGFEVEQAQAFHAVPMKDAEGNVMGESFEAAENQYFLRRSDTHRILSDRTTVTESYYIYQNEMFFDLMKQAAYKTGLQIKRAGIVEHGKRCWMIAEFPERFGRLDINTGKYRGDYLVPYLYASLTHDGQSTIRLQLVANRKCCANVFTGFMRKIVRQMEFELMNLDVDDGARVKKIRHTKSVEVKVEDAIKEIERMYEAWSDVIAKFRQMAETRIEGEQLQKTIRKILSVAQDTPVAKLHTKTKNRMEEFTRRFNQPSLGTYGETLWDLMNAVTAVNTHDRTIKKGKSRLNNLIYGTGGNFELRAFRILDAMVSNN
jgi:phage/plasmid-like protein (TIGR03299 family)